MEKKEEEQTFVHEKSKSIEINVRENLKSNPKTCARLGTQNNKKNHNIYLSGIAYPSRAPGLNPRFIGSFGSSLLVFWFVWFMILNQPVFALTP
jgi:hypothetical protein